MVAREPSNTWLEVGALRQGHPVPSGHLLPHSSTSGCLHKTSLFLLSPWLCQGKGGNQHQNCTKPRAYHVPPSSCVAHWCLPSSAWLLAWSGGGALKSQCLNDRMHE